MDVATQSFTCEIRIEQAKNLELIQSQGNLFVRCYLSSGNYERVIKLDTKEISSNSNLVLWNECFSLECLGTGDSVDILKQESAVFELRRRNTNSVLGKIGGGGGSQLLGRAEIPWRTVFESPKMEIEKWVMMASKKKTSLADDEDVKPPSVRIAIRVRGPEMGEIERRKKRNGKLRKLASDDCGCCEENRCQCQDYETFALVGAFEAL